MCDAYEMWRCREHEREKWLAKKPVCSRCEEHIQDERLFDIHGVLYCEGCACDEFKKWTEDYET